MKKNIIYLLMITILLISISGCTSKNSSKYCVKFETYGGSSYDNIIVSSGEKIEEPMMPINGTKSFQGWFKDSDFSEKWFFDQDTVTKDTILYAKFISKYKVSYYYNNELKTRKNVVEGNKAENIKYLTAAVEVTGWYTENECVNKYDFDTILTNDIELYATIQYKTTWNFPEDMDIGSGWCINADSTNNKGKLTAKDDGMLVEFDNPSAWDTYLRTPELGIPNLEEYNKITIKYKNLSDESNLKVYFFRNTDLVWDGKGENFGGLKTNMKEEDNWESYTVNISQTSVLKNNWNGILWLLRFEIKQANGEVGKNPAGTSFILNSISLEK